MLMALFASAKITFLPAPVRNALLSLSVVTAIIFDKR